MVSLRNAVLVGIFIQSILTVCAAWASDAVVVRYRDLDRRWRRIELKHGELRGDIHDFTTLEFGDDSSEMEACFEGEADSVCDLLERVVAQVGARGTAKYRLTCEKRSGSWVIARADAPGRTGLRIPRRYRTCSGR